MLQMAWTIAWMALTTPHFHLHLQIPSMMVPIIILCHAPLWQPLIENYTEQPLANPQHHSWCLALWNSIQNSDKKNCTAQKNAWRLIFTCLFHSIIKQFCVLFDTSNWPFHFCNTKTISYQVSQILCHF